MNILKKIATAIGFEKKPKSREPSEEELKEIMKPLENLLYELFVAEPKEKASNKDDEGKQ